MLIKCVAAFQLSQKFVVGFRLLLFRAHVIVAAAAAATGGGGIVAAVAVAAVAVSVLPVFNFAVRRR